LNFTCVGFVFLKLDCGSHCKVEEPSSLRWTHFREVLSWGGGGELVNMPRKFKFVTDLTKLSGTLKSYVLIFIVTVVARV